MKWVYRVRRVYLKYIQRVSPLQWLLVVVAPPKIVVLWISWIVISIKMSRSAHSPLLPKHIVIFHHGNEMIKHSDRGRESGRIQKLHSQLRQRLSEEGKKNRIGTKVHMVRADNDEEREELMQRETVRTGHKLRKLYWLAERSGLVRRALEKTLLERDWNWFRKAPAPRRKGKWDEMLIFNRGKVLGPTWTWAVIGRCIMHVTQ